MKTCFNYLLFSVFVSKIMKFFMLQYENENIWFLLCYYHSFVAMNMLTMLKVIGLCVVFRNPAFFRISVNISGFGNL